MYTLFSLSLYIYIYIHTYKDGDLYDPAGTITGGSAPKGGTQRHINGVVSNNNKYNNVGFGGIKRPF